MVGPEGLERQRPTAFDLPAQRFVTTRAGFRPGSYHGRTIQVNNNALHYLMRRIIVVA
jgi:hypothetical protein